MFCSWRESNHDFSVVWSVAQLLYRPTTLYWLHICVYFGGPYISGATFCSVAPNICSSAVRNVRDVTLLTRRFLLWLLDFVKWWHPDLFIIGVYVHDVTALYVCLGFQVYREFYFGVVYYTLTLCYVDLYSQIRCAVDVNECASIASEKECCVSCPRYLFESHCRICIPCSV